MSNKLAARLKKDGVLYEMSSSDAMHTDDDFDGEHFYITAIDVKVFSGEIVSVGQPRRYDQKEDACTAPVRCTLYPWREILFPQRFVDSEDEDSPSEIASIAMESPLALLGNVSGKFLLLFGEQDIPVRIGPCPFGANGAVNSTRYLTKYYLRQIRCSGIRRESRNKKSTLHVAGLT